MQLNTMLNKLQNSTGIEAFPFKLLIVGIVILIVTPMVWYGMIEYSRFQSESNLERELDKLVTAIKQAYAGDPGTTVKVKLNLQAGFLDEFEWLQVGDIIGEHGGPYKSILWYKFAGTSRMPKVVERPNIWLTTPDNTALKLTAGTHTLIIEHCRIGPKDFIVLKSDKDKDKVFKMADVAVYDLDITAETNRGFIPVAQNMPPGMIINVTVHNLGNLDTDKSPWPKGEPQNKIRVEVIDQLIETGDIMHHKIEFLDTLKAGEAHKFTYHWDLVGNNSPQNKSLLKRKIIVNVELDDTVDEITAEDNSAIYKMTLRPPVVKEVIPSIDDPAVPGIEGAVAQTEVDNEVEVIVEDPDGKWDLWKVEFWYGKDKFGEAEPTYIDFTPYNGFKVIISLGELKTTCNLTIKPYERSGLGGDHVNETIYVEQAPAWIEHIGGRGEHGGKKTKHFDAEKYAIHLIIDIPADLVKGFEDAFGDKLPFIKGMKSGMNNSYKLELEIPIGGEISFKREMDLSSKLFNKGNTGKVTGSGKVMGKVKPEAKAWFEARLHVGYDKDIEIDLSKLFELFNNLKVLVAQFNDLGPIIDTVLPAINWTALKHPESLDSLLAELDAIQAGIDADMNLKSCFKNIGSSISEISDIFEYFKTTYGDLTELWETIKPVWEAIITQDYTGIATSLLHLISFEAEAGLKIGAQIQFPVIRMSYPIYPPFVTAGFDMGGKFTPGLDATAKLYGDPSGLVFESVEIGADIDLNMYFRGWIHVGIDFGFAGGYIEGSLSGEPTFTFTAGLEYTTDERGRSFQHDTNTDFCSEYYYDDIDYDDVDYYGDENLTRSITRGLTKYFSGTLDICLRLALKAVAKFLAWKKEWTLYEGRWNFGHGEFDLVEGTASWEFLWEEAKRRLDDGEGTLPATQEIGGTIIVPSTPQLGLHPTTGELMLVWSTDTNAGEQAKEPNYKLLYSIYQDRSWSSPAFVCDDPAGLEIDAEPVVAYEPDGDALVLWTRCEVPDSEKYEFVNTNATVDDIVKHARIYYAEYDNETNTWSASTPLFPPVSPVAIQLQPSVAIDKTTGDAIAIWVQDPDGKLSTTNNIELYYSTRSDGENMWSESKRIIDTENENTEYDCSVAYDSNGDAIAAWIQDADSNINTTADQQVMWSIYHNAEDVWAAPMPLTTDTSRKEAVVVAGNGDITALLWLNITTDRKSPANNISQLNFCIWNAELHCWEDCELLYYSDHMMMSPNLFVTPDGRIIVTWIEDCGAYNETRDERGYIYYMMKDMRVPSPKWTAPARLGNLTDLLNIETTVAVDIIENTLIYVAKDYEKVGSQTVEGFWTGIDFATDTYEGELDPDLAIASVEVSSATPMESDQIDITATVKNVGKANAQNILVRFYNGAPTAASSTIIDEVTISELYYLHEHTVTITWVVPQGKHDIYVVVDPLDTIPEESDANNMQSVVVRCLPDLRISADDIMVVGGSSVPLENIQLTAVIHNDGNANATAVKVDFYIGDPALNGTLIADTQTIASIGIGKTGEVTVIYQEPPVGSSEIFIVVHGDRDTDLNPENNKASKSILVLPDLSISSTDISIEPEIGELVEGQSVTITATIHNVGSVPVNTAMVKFYTATQYIGYRLIGTSTSLNPGTTETVMITWHQPPAGVHIVYVKLDPGDQVVELTETNNLAFVTIAVLPATASDLASEVEVTEDAPGEVDVEVTVTNEGETDATNVVVTVYDGDPEKGGTPIYTTELPVVEGGSAETINFKWYTTEGHKEVYVVVDELGMISEPDETDNTASTTIKVSRAEPVTVERRDQWLTVIIIIAVVAVVLVLAIVIYWRKRRFA